MRCDLLRTIKERQEQLQGLDLRCTASSVCRQGFSKQQWEMCVHVYMYLKTESKCLGETTMLKKF